MSDLISRSAAIDGLDGHYVERATLNDWQEGWNAALDWVGEIYLEELPSAEPDSRVVAWREKQEPYKEGENVSDNYD